MERRPLVWRPFGEVERFRREIDRLLEELLPIGRESETPVFVPPVEVYETDKEVVVKVDLPGVNKEDVYRKGERGGHKGGEEGRAGRDRHQPHQD